MTATTSKAPLAKPQSWTRIALISDLHAKRLLEQTLAALGTEFGRTPHINGNDGRDHHKRVFTCLLAGAGAQGWGRVEGGG